MHVMCLAGTFDSLYLTIMSYCLRYSSDNHALSNCSEIFHFFTNDVPAAAWTIFFSFSLLSVQFRDELASPGKVLWIHITGFASWRRPSVQ